MLLPLLLRAPLVDDATCADNHVPLPAHLPCPLPCPLPSQCAKGYKVKDGKCEQLVDGVGCE